jgi:hypothetical protein
MHLSCTPGYDGSKLFSKGGHDGQGQKLMGKGSTSADTSRGHMAIMDPPEQLASLMRRKGREKAEENNTNLTVAKSVI